MNDFPVKNKERKEILHANQSHSVCVYRLLKK